MRRQVLKETAAQAAGGAELPRYSGGANTFRARTHLAAGTTGATLMTGSPLRLRIWASRVWPLTGVMDVSVTVESRPAADSSSGNRLNDELNSCGAQDGQPHSGAMMTATPPIMSVRQAIRHGAGGHASSAGTQSDTWLLQLGALLTHMLRWGNKGCG